VTDAPPSSTPRPPPRLFVLFARDARVGLVLRRGPSAWVHLVQWDTQRDVFTPGAWFRGRIYEDKCDLSPDGELLVYAAYQGNRWGSEYTGSWTALSRPPWLSALALWPMGTTYGGGGRFLDDRRLILRGTGKLHPKHPPGGLASSRLEVTPGPAPLQGSSGEAPGADWSGRDHDNRLVHGTGGRLFRRTGVVDVELADFNGQEPDSRPPPEWATRPL
jgi:hypothetical protein